MPLPKGLMEAKLVRWEGHWADRRREVCCATYVMSRNASANYASAGGCSWIITQGGTKRVWVLWDEVCWAHSPYFAGLNSCYAAGVGCGVVHSSMAIPYPSRIIYIEAAGTFSLRHNNN
jgi:hypothetical protein